MSAKHLRNRFSDLILFSALVLLVCSISGPVAASDVNTTKNEATKHAVDAPGNRFLMRSIPGGDSEERAIDVKLPGAAALKNLVSSRMKKLATSVKDTFPSKNQRATNNLFARLEVGKGDSQIFQSPAYKEWAQFVAKLYSNKPGKAEAAMFSTLTAHYSDEALTKLLTEAKRVPQTSSAATGFESMLLDRWRTKGKTLDTIYARLKLNVDEDDLLKNPLLGTWISYGKRLKKEDPYNLLLLKLMNRYDDEGLARVITRAQKDASTSSIALILKQAQLQHWQSKGLTADDVFSRLRLNADNGEKLLKNPIVGLWISYVFKLRKENPYTLLLLKLTNRLDDEGLARVITTAQKDVSTSSIALSLKEAQFRHWQSNGLKPNDVFSRLRLNIGSGDELLRNPNLDLWVSYVSKFRKEDPYKLLLLKLGRRYDEIGLARVITTAQKDVSTSFIASNLKQAQLKHWQSNGLKPNDLLSRLRLNVGSGDELLRNPNLDLWVSYVEKLGKADPYNLLLLMLKSRFDDEGFARVITAAQRDDSTSSIAGHLRKAQLQSWQSSQFTPETLFSRLQLNVVSGDELVKNPGLNMWVSYVDVLKKKPVELLFSQLKTRFTEDVATRLLVAAWNENKRLIPRRKVDELLQKKWHSEEKTADDIFKLLRLNRKDGDLFVNPMLSSWSFYLRSLVDDDSYKLMLSMLRKHYDDATLKKMIDQAKASDNEGTYKDIALKLEAEMRG